MKKTVLSVLALSALVFSCKKDDEKSNAEKIVGKWNQVTVFENSHYNGADHRDTLTYSPGSYTVEFTSNGNLYVKTANFADTGTYKIDGSNLIIRYGANSDSDTSQIKTLTGSDMSVYSKDLDTNGDFYEVTSNLKK